MNELTADTVRREYLLHSIQNILPGLLSESKKLKYTNIYLFVSKLFINKLLGRKHGHNREEVGGDWRKVHNDELHKCALHEILLGRLNPGG